MTGPIRRATTRSLVLAALAAIGLAACQSTTAPVPAPQPVASATPSYVTRPDFRLPEGAGCSGEIARFRAVMDNELATGHVTREVHGRVIADMRTPEGACAAGRDGEARAALTAVKRRYGYPS
ncbi:hypothetical protein [Phreatobacter cathodiphilus]|uniref:Lipoprotein n=1 Tax=Phreatobacter cathodiphilus TaxID=1868589 RepID=A0A2S0N6P3_9HYPH|nr:hypothetical protein [Phreatobacter cathodiphilus]AVO43786.1 hypothetical protein C6569_01125 [Phreatobacter cathodiphilus]